MGAAAKINPKFNDLRGLADWAGAYVEGAIKSVMCLPLFALNDVPCPCKFCLGAAKRAARLQVFNHGTERNNETLAVYIDFEIACPHCAGTSFEGARVKK